MSTSMLIILIVFYGNCKHCTNEVSFDGKEQGLLNMGTYIVTHRLLTDYLHSFLLNG